MLDHTQSKTAGKRAGWGRGGILAAGGGDKGEGWQHLRNGLLGTDLEACDARDD